MSIKDKFNEKFLTPSGYVSRIINVTVLVLIAFAAFGIFYFIKFIACSEVNCHEGSLGKLINTMSPLFIIYGICCFIVACFIFKNKSIASLYSDSISMLASIGIVLAITLAISINEKIHDKILKLLPMVAGTTAATQPRSFGFTLTI